MTKGIVTPPEGGTVDIAGSVFAVPDIFAHPAHGDVQLRAKAPLTAVLSLLDQPPFNYMEKAGQPVTLGTGMAEVSAHIDLPLINFIGPGDVVFQVAGKVHDFATDVVVKGRTDYRAFADGDSG